MRVLKVINTKENDIYSYTAMVSALEFKKRGHEIKVLANNIDFVKEFASKNQIDVSFIDFYYLTGYRDIGDFDVIEIYGYTKLNHFLLKGLLKKKCVKVLKICSFYDEAFKNFIKENLKSFSLITVLSKSLKDELIFDGVGDDKIFCLNPVITGRWETAKGIRVFTTIARPYRVITVYRKKKIKELELFLMIAREILKLNSDVNFSIIGVKDEGLREITRNWGISHKIDMLGWREDMPEVMATSHIYLKPSLESDISRSVLEAMYSGVVVVSSDTKGISDFIISDYNGVVVRSGNIQSYVKAVLSLINEPAKFQTISTVSYNYALANFRADIITKVEEILYDEFMISQKGDRS